MCDHTGLLVRILTEHPNEAPFIHDINQQRPIDLAGAQRNLAAQALLFPLTYPDVYRQAEMQSEQDSEVQIRQLGAYSDIRYALNQRRMRDRRLDR